MQTSAYLGWQGYLDLALCVGLAIAPLVFSKKHRFAYIAGWCVSSILILGVLKVRNWEAVEMCGMRLVWHNATSWKIMGATLWDGPDMIGLIYEQRDDTKSKAAAVIPSNTYVYWSRLSSKGGLKYPDHDWFPSVRRWGFQIEGDNILVSPGISASLRGVAVPYWFGIVILSVIPALYGRQLLKQRKVQRWIEAGRCRHCGYDLRATTEKCPECGTIPAMRKTADALPPTTTSGD